MKVFRPAAAIAARSPVRAAPPLKKSRMASSAASEKIINMGNINKCVTEMQYAVRGAVPMRAEKIAKEIAAGKKYPFDEVLYCNIGNPHSVGQSPLSFYREVTALVDCPQLLAHPNIAQMFKPDVVERARTLHAAIAGGTGAYSHSKGVEHIRNTVAGYIEARDGFPCDPEDVYIQNGASDAIQKVLNTVISKPTDGILVPIPQYPIYSALIRLLDGELIGYHMDESKEWGLDMAHLREEIKSARARGVLPKALVVINPGNPVGNVLTEQDLTDLVKLCKEERLILLSDEVYQENIYGDRPFISVKKIVRQLGPEYDDFELVSFHSTSKGMNGECGRRGGYMELVGMDQEVKDQIYKLCSAALCSNLNGQLMVDLMLSPPKPGDASYESYRAEYDGIFDALKRKSQMVYKALNAIEGISVQPLTGAMYAFPKIEMPAKAVAAAAKEGLAPDAMYALSLLETTGICAVPGSGFGQREGTHHLRMTFLPEEDKLAAALDKFAEHHRGFMAKYK